MLLAAVLAFISIAAESSGALRSLERAERAMHAFEYATAIRLLDGVIADDDASVDQRVRARELLVVSHWASGRRDEAVRQARALFALRPTFSPSPDAHPPDVLQIFAEAQPPNAPAESTTP